MPGVNDAHKAEALGSQGIYRSVANRMSWVVIGISVFVFLSWVFDIEAGKRVLPALQSMKFNTALCFIACGVILRRKVGAKAPGSDPVAAFLIVFILLVSGLTIFEYASGWPLGIDNLVFLDTATAPENWPGRMSGATALCFSLIGFAWLASMFPIRHSTLMMQLLALAMTIISSAALIGFVFGVKEFRLPLFSTMALHTALLFVLCGLGTLLVQPGEGLMSSTTSRYIGGRSLRRLLPFIAVTPILMSWLSMQGVLAGYYSEAFGFALSSLSSILVLGFVSWLGADALNCEEERFRSTIDASPVATIMIDQNGIIRMANRLVHSVFRYPDHGLVGMSVEQLLPDQFRQGHKDYRREYTRNPTQRILGEGRELFALRQDGTEFRAEIALNPVQTADGRYVMAAVVDITDRVAAEQKMLRLNRMHKVLSGINTLIVRTQARDSLFEASTRIAVEDGELPAALIVQYDSKLQQCKILHAHAAEEQIKDRLLTSSEVDSIRECVQQHRVVVRNDLAGHPGGEDDPADLAKLGIRALAAFPLTSNNHSPEVALLLCGRESFFFDEPELKLLLEVAGDISFAIANLDKSQELAYLTHFDKVTDLPNRRLLTDRLQQAMFQADSYQGIVSILYMDIDRFKQVNDSFGHVGGDEVLRQVAERISACVGKADTVSRWGGDEFIVLLPGQSAGDAAGIANAISGALHSLIVLGGSRELFVSCSIGIAVYPHKGRNMDALINSARSAMSVIKEQGGNDYRHFVSGGDQAFDDGLELETSLRQALGQKQFQLYYQPQIDIVSGRVVGLEALLRWHHPTQGMIAPDRFIPLAEKTGLIIPIGEWVLSEACRQVAAQRGLKVAVNLSARQFHQQDLVAMTRRILDETGMPPANLELEITESALIYDVELAIATMEQLNDLGVSVSLDDFGTGYSSLSYLKRFPIDMLKIDKSFIDEVTTDPGSNVIVKTIIVMAHSLGLKVIAEGVETKEQLAMLREHGCDQAQGYLIARPLPCQEALEIAAQTFVVPTS